MDSFRGLCFSSTDGTKGDGRMDGPTVHFVLSMDGACLMYVEADRLVTS